MRSWIVVSAPLIAAGVALFAYKVLVLGYPLSTAEEPGTWRVDFVVDRDRPRQPHAWWTSRCRAPPATSACSPRR